MFLQISRLLRNCPKKSWTMGQSGPTVGMKDLWAWQSFEETCLVGQRPACQRANARQKKIQIRETKVDQDWPVLVDRDCPRQNGWHFVSSFRQRNNEHVPQPTIQPTANSMYLGLQHETLSVVTENNHAQDKVWNNFTNTVKCLIKVGTKNALFSTSVYRIC